MPRRQPAILMLAAMLLMPGLAACAGETGDDVAVVVDTVEGIERLTYSEDPAPALDWSLDTVAVIGEAMAAEEYQFTSPGPDDLAGLSDGGIVVTDRQGMRVLEYGPAGRHRATYGRPGQGPGEIRSPAGVAVEGTDTVWVNDLRNRRLTGYPRAGDDPRVVPYVRGDVFPGSRIALWEDGFYQVVGEIGPPGEPIPEPLLRLDEQLNPLDTLWVPPADRIDIVELSAVGMEVVVGVPQVFWPRFRWRALSTGDVVVNDAADYVFRVVAGDGTVRQIVRRDPPARPTTEADREAARERALEEAGFSVSVDGQGPDAEAQRRMAEQRIEAMTFADRIPRIVALRVDPRDRIWVGVSEDSADVVQRIDVYTADGTLLGELRDLPMPAAFTGTDRLLTTRKDELDVPQIVVLRITEAPTP
ncbi:MAG: hypothetical protein R3314_08275 [Longimicrobiales bacterium]|nr:hypothetical protein [Longimicrobiales bacterium]